MNEISSNRPPVAIRSLVRELELLLQSTQRILEIGCGPDSPLQYLAKGRHIEGLDVHEPWLQKAREKGILRDYHLANAMEIDRLFTPGQFDAVVALDLIEHLEKADGHELIKKMEVTASNRIVIFTPNGFLPQHDESNPWNDHRSGWTVSEFRQLGFTVTGMYGWKPLRGEWARLKYRPRLFWGVVSELSHWLITRRQPQFAFSLLCTKRLQPAAAA